MRNKGNNMLDRNTVKMISSDIEKALGDVATKYNVEIKHGNASYGSENMSLKLKVSTIGNDGSVMTKEATDFNTYASMYGITKSLGDVINYMGGEYKIVGFKPRSKKWPVIVEKLNHGGRYKFPVDIVK
ncbi:MAG: hypothetical protein H8E03_00820 [Pelagibacteraceae bacterium]|nr:hypothetical protein [Pelagibacteraceae bacterium]